MTLLEEQVIQQREQDYRAVVDDRDRIKREAADLRERNRILQERLDRLIKGDAA